jgi:hypothetical protein
LRFGYFHVAEGRVLEKASPCMCCYRFRGSLFSGHYKYRMGVGLIDPGVRRVGGDGG